MLVVRALVGCVVGAVALVAASLVATPALVQAPAGGADEHVVSSGPAQRWAARVADLLAGHGCWTDAAPAGAPAPAHAVVTLPGARPRLVAAEVGYGIWLDGDPGVLHGSCP